MNKPQNQIQIKFHDTVLVANLNNSRMCQDFIALMPLSLIFNTLFGRRKYGRLPHGLVETGQPMQTFEAGDIAYWSPGPGTNIFYGTGSLYDDNYSADTGFYLLGKIESDLRTLNITQFLHVEIETL